jgi:2-polyprenyl-6-methoxyphenol hydroxylase-like FAD-dependent oxidoreductase
LFRILRHLVIGADGIGSVLRKSLNPEQYEYELAGRGASSCLRTDTELLQRKASARLLVTFDLRLLKLAGSGLAMSAPRPRSFMSDCLMTSHRHGPRLCRSILSTRMVLPDAEPAP